MLSSGYFEGDHPSRVLIVRGLPDGYDALRCEGVAVRTFEAERMLPGVKTTNYVQGRIGLESALREGAHEAIYRDCDGLLREGVTSNVMALFGETIVTPKQHCLNGITLRSVQHAAETIGLHWQARDLKLAEAQSADEFWISSTIRELIPVVAIDGEAIGSGGVGSWFPKIYQAFRSRCEQQSVLDANP